MIVNIRYKQENWLKQMIKRVLKNSGVLNILKINCCCGKQKGSLWSNAGGNFPDLEVQELESVNLVR